MLHTEKVTKEHTFATCDFCNNMLNRAHHVCHGCDKHVCYKCSSALDRDPFDGQSYGDYRPRACHECMTNLGDFSPQAFAIQEAADKQIENLRQQWKELCKRTD